jgi:biotin carboxyl carrier protein
MKSYQIRVNDREYHVEIADLAARPVRVKVDGEWFDVWPEETRTTQPEPPPARVAIPARETAPRTNLVTPPPGNGSPSGAGQARAVKAPLPGVVIAIHVTLGEEVSAGQPVCVVEAMKMNNVVRASEGGKVVAVRVTTGQHVKHHDVLVEMV